MGWREIKTLHCLVREKLSLRLTCECGYVAEPSTSALIGAINRRVRFRSVDLANLQRTLRCGKCGGKNFEYELLPNNTEPAGTALDP